MELRDLSVTMSSTLQQLSFLDLSGNEFAWLPTAVSCITTLQVLDLSDNGDLQMDDIDLDTLAALPHLRRLDCHKPFNPFKPFCGTWSYSSKAVLRDIRDEFPHIELADTSYKECMAEFKQQLGSSALCVL